MSDDIYEALARTALLAELDIFGAGASHRFIIDGFRATTARIVADRANVNSPAGQTAVVTLYAQLAMMGLQIDLDVPDIGLLVAQPPLHGTDLVSGLVDYSNDLLPGGSSRPSAEADVTFVLGDSPAPATAIRVTGTDWQAGVGPSGTAARWQGTGPVGAMAAAAAAAVEGLRAAVPRIADRLNRLAPTDLRWRTVPDRRVGLDLRRYQVDDGVGLGSIDAISGGAITNAALYTLLRIPSLTASIRIIEPDRLALSNLNRYALARRSMLSTLKTDALMIYATRDIEVSGAAVWFDAFSAARLAPIAKRLLVGVDHIPSRWAATRAAPSSWIGVGASSHDYVLASAHPAGAACAGCVHPRDEPTSGEIPTISFVSFWAGLMQALELLTAVVGRAPISTRATHVWPLGLDRARGIHPYSQIPVALCPVGCTTSAPVASGGDL